MEHTDLVRKGNAIDNYRQTEGLKAKDQVGRE